MRVYYVLLRALCIIYVSRFSHTSLFSGRANFGALCHIVFFFFLISGSVKFVDSLIIIIIIIIITHYRRKVRCYVYIRRYVTSLRSVSLPWHAQDSGQRGRIQGLLRAWLCYILYRGRNHAPSRPDIFSVHKPTRFTTGENYSRTKPSTYVTAASYVVTAWPLLINTPKRTSRATTGSRVLVRFSDIKSLGYMGGRRDPVTLKFTTAYNDNWF